MFRLIDSVVMVKDLDTGTWWGRRESGRTGWKYSWTRKRDAQAAINYARKKNMTPKRLAIVEILAGESGHELGRTE